MRCDGVLRVARCMLTTPGEHHVGIAVDIPDSIRVRDRAGLDTTARVIGIGGITAAGIAALYAADQASKAKQPQRGLGT